MLKALAHPTRIKILELLRQGERCVCELLEELNLEQSNVSQHLAILRKQRILKARKKGLKVLYSVKNQNIYNILDSAMDILKQEILEDSSLVNEINEYPKTKNL